MSLRPGDRVKTTEHAPTRIGEEGTITRVNQRSITVRFGDGELGAFLFDEVELVALLRESSTVFYFRRGGDVLLMSHGSTTHYCVFSQWERSKAFKRAGKGGPALSMAPERRFGGLGGLSGALRIS